MCAHGRVCALCRVHECACTRVPAGTQAGVLCVHTSVCGAGRARARARRGFGLLSRCRSVSAADKQPGSRRCGRRGSELLAAQRAVPGPRRASSPRRREGGREGGRAGGREYLLQPLITEFEIPASRCHLFSGPVRLASAFKRKEDKNHLHFSPPACWLLPPPLRSLSPSLSAHRAETGAGCSGRRAGWGGFFKVLGAPAGVGAAPA